MRLFRIPCVITIRGLTILENVMKNLILVLIVVVVNALYSADDSMIINLKNGTSDTLNILDLSRISIDTIATSVIDVNGIIRYERFENLKNYPNPFSDETNFSFELKTASEVLLKIYDSKGKFISEIRSECSIGYNEIKWSNQNLPQGVYYAKLETTDFTAIKKIIIIK